MNILSDYPVWFYFICILGGVIVSALLYWRDRSSDFSRPVQWLLAVLRFVVVSVIAFFLLSPMVRSIRLSKEKPIILLALDNSASIASEPGDGLDTIRLAESWENLARELGTKYEVHPFLFGDNVKEGLVPDFNDKYSDASVLLQEIETRFTNRNVGALVLATDGMFNRGRNPAYMNESSAYPVYSIALGDTSLRKDVKISRLYYNRITYLNSEFPVELVVQAEGYQGEQLKVNLYENAKLLGQQQVSVTSNSFSQTLTFRVVAEEAGTRQYLLSVDVLDGEVSEENNRRLAFIEVLDARQKVLILARAPHPDVTAIRQALESNMNYSVEVSMADEAPASFGAYNLVILHDLPTASFPANRLQEMLDENNTPAWFILGQNADYRFLSGLGAGISLDNVKQKSNDASAYVLEGFGLFSVPGSLKESIKNYPPLKTPFADYRFENSVQTLLAQKIGNVETDYPLLAFNQDGERKTGVLLGDGIWRWRLYNYFLRASHDEFNTLINKSVQYLSVRADKRRFRVETAYEYAENQNVIIDAELYNEAFELVNEADARINIIDDTGRVFPYNFSRKGLSYTLDLGVMQPGRYNYSAEAQYAGEGYEVTGVFTVSPVVAEMLRTRADHGVLYQMAESSGGEVFYPGEQEGLLQNLMDNDQIKTIVYEKKMFNELINLKWIFFILLAFLTVEWFLRRWLGSY